jgi:hypothetical protein
MITPAIFLPPFNSYSTCIFAPQAVLSSHCFTKSCLWRRLITAAKIVNSKSAITFFMLSIQKGLKIVCT